MSDRDINGLCLALQEAFKGFPEGEATKEQCQTLVTCAIGLVQCALLDINRAADALEVIARYHRMMVDRT